jgi:uncharacterized protein (DUF952 family)
MPIIYHIATTEAWNKAKETGFYEHPSLNEEGFIHCSEEHQVAAVLDRFFKDATDIVKLTIDTNKLRSRYVQEWSPSTLDTFPHVYGPINTDAVLSVEPIA